MQRLSPSAALGAGPDLSIGFDVEMEPGQSGADLERFIKYNLIVTSFLGLEEMDSREEIPKCAFFKTVTLNSISHTHHFCSSQVKSLND